ncbi:hypothetical protein FV242_12945 [Methylobacterium sp. WL64]|uniref:hypothetical protein n=1 Tax=Methylobacterium sp. WL64 TaxID=2603894 RepID=UPI0011C7CF3E|nr:hypothetical protein [Methylobacterium sp. WL64]TXN02907.1 hypothetical protein FV242_12945 [Methylobacterium sp. WL64]
MRRVLMPTILLILAVAPARAEDFTGFYAGLNAGLASGKSGDRIGTMPNPRPHTGSGRSSAGPDLPPSASSAAAALQRAGRNNAGTTLGR